MTENSSTSEEYEILSSSSPSPSHSELFCSELDENTVNEEFYSSKSDENVLEPTLRIANNGNMNDLEHELQEVMEEKAHSPTPLSKKISNIENDVKIEENEENGSKSCVSPSSDYTIFNQILYLGAANVNAPRSEGEIQKNITILNSEPDAQPIEVSISIPSNSEGRVIIYYAGSSTEMRSYKINSIIYCAEGRVDTPQAPCFAFTSLREDSAQTAIFQCFVFKCQIPEAVVRIISTFVNAFHNVPENEPKKISGQFENLFDISLEIREEDNKGNFNTVPRDKECFKLRYNVDKQLILTVGPAPSNEDNGCCHSGGLVIERCFGLLVAHGRKVKHADMNLLEMDSSGPNTGGKFTYQICGLWNPRDPVFSVLNKETPKDVRVYMTVAVDLVIRDISEPVRFLLETKVRVFPQSERFWYFSKKNLTHLFSIKLKQVEVSGPGGERQLVVTSVDNLGEVERGGRTTLPLSLNLTSLTSSTISSISGRSPSINSIGTPCNEEDEDDEPLLSGSGEVSKECPEGELEMWKQVLPKWQANSNLALPKGIGTLVKRGVPEALRGEVWQLLANCINDTDMMETYRVLITKECHCEQVIKRDINRTFPAHEYFKQSGGCGQDALYKISRAYSVYDGEVSYCQGTSFLAAALLLHMPEEQAFCVFTKIMFDYGLRNLFKENFEVLHLRFYQLDRMMEEQVPELFYHFREQGVESHMFASQWFLTLYTAKFPLFMVFHYLDVLLLLGIDSAFQVAIALLQLSKKELLSLDFEGILKYFRVSLPKKYRSEENARLMMKLAMSIKTKKLHKYEREYLAMKQQEALREDPIYRLERENQRLLDDKMRMERENDDLARELMNSKVNMMHQIDQLEDRCELLANDYQSSLQQLSEAEEEKRRQMEEAVQVKDLLKKEVEKGDSEGVKSTCIITDYKKICSDLSHRLEKEQTERQKAINEYKRKVATCETCSALLSPLCEEKSFIPNEIDSEEPSQQIKELEMELAKTKLALVEVQCKNQDLTHQLISLTNELQSNKNTWLQKTITSISSLKEKSQTSPPNITHQNQLNQYKVGISKSQSLSNNISPLRRGQIDVKSSSSLGMDSSSDGEVSLPDST